MHVRRGAAVARRLEVKPIGENTRFGSHRAIQALFIIDPGKAMFMIAIAVFVRHDRWSGLGKRIVIIINKPGHLRQTSNTTINTKALLSL